MPKYRIMCRQVQTVSHYKVVEVEAADLESAKQEISRMRSGDPPFFKGEGYSRTSDWDPLMGQEVDKDEIDVGEEFEIE